MTKNIMRKICMAPLIQKGQRSMSTKMKRAAASEQQGWSRGNADGNQAASVYLHFLPLFGSYLSSQILANPSTSS
jgi:hypothetical protein